MSFQGPFFKTMKSEDGLPHFALCWFDLWDLSGGRGLLSQREWGFWPGWCLRADAGATPRLVTAAPGLCRVSRSPLWAETWVWRCLWRRLRALEERRSSKWNEKVWFRLLETNNASRVTKRGSEGTIRRNLARWPFWTTDECSCCFHCARLSILLSRNLFRLFSLCRDSSAYCLSASSRSIRYTTSPRTSFIFFNSGDNGQLSRGWKNCTRLARCFCTASSVSYRWTEAAVCEPGFAKPCNDSRATWWAGGQRCCLKQL